jgi:hypothetical protein
MVLMLSARVSSGWVHGYVYISKDACALQNLISYHGSIHLAH